MTRAPSRISHPASRFTSMRLLSKVCLITGAGAGIGRASVLAFAAEGARVAAVDLDAAAGEETVRLTRESGGDAFCHRADVSRAADAAGMVEAVVARWGRLDALFNNAG